MAETCKISQMYLSGEDGKKAHDLFNDFANKNFKGNKTKAFLNFALDNETYLKKGVKLDSKK